MKTLPSAIPTASRSPDQNENITAVTPWKAKTGSLCQDMEFEIFKDKRNIVHSKIRLSSIDACSLNLVIVKNSGNNLFELFELKSAIYGDVVLPLMP